MIALATLFLLAATAFGQTTTPTTIIAGLPFTVEWTHPLDARTGDVSFQAWTDTGITKNWPLSELTITAIPTGGFAYKAPHPAITKGLRAFKVRAKDASSFADSPILMLDTQPPPMVPTSQPVVTQKVGEP